MHITSETDLISLELPGLESSIASNESSTANTSWFLSAVGTGLHNTEFHSATSVPIDLNEELTPCDLEVH